MTRTSTRDLQEEFLTALRKGQQTMIGALRIWVETVQAVTPKLTGVYAPITDRLPKLPVVSVPFADKLPSPKEAVDGAYGLAEELLANQRKFAEDVLDTAAPLLPGHVQDLRHAETVMKPVVVTTEPRAAEPKPAATVVPVPGRVVVKPVTPVPQATVAKPEPKAPARKAASPKVTPPKAAAKTPTPKAATPKAATPKRTPKTTPKGANAS